jgi:nitrogen fixation NifU-like protein
MIEETYSDIILELNKRPLHKGTLENPTIQFHDTNPFCGDEVTIYLKVNASGTIDDVSFQGKGCALSQASASLVCDVVLGKSIDEVLKMDVDFILNDLGIPQVKNNAARIKCVMLPLKVLKMCGYNWIEKK